MTVERAITIQRAIKKKQRSDTKIKAKKIKKNYFSNREKSNIAITNNNEKKKLFQEIEICRILGAPKFFSPTLRKRDLISF